MGFFNSDKKEALQRLEKAQREYESNGKRANSEVQSLYKKKKEAIKAIESAERILKKQPDFGTDNIRKIADAKSSIRLFQEAIQKEIMALKSIKDSSSGIVGAGAAGIATGAAVATLGPTAAMALATTFGTAATGTAISALSGVAATNAALAWIGGGAIAVGGGGMAAGTAILAMAGPIGWAIGGITIGATSLFVRKNNKKVAHKADNITNEVKSINRKLKQTIKSIEDARDEISRDIITLDVLMEGSIIDNQVRYNYPEIVSTIISLCNNINKKFPI